MFINLNQNKNLKLFKIISEAAARKGQSVYAVGGFVRDLLTKRKAPTDIDFVTESSGIELAESIAKEIDPKTKVAVFKTYGTAMFKYKDLELEFVGARKESYSEDSRKPSVEIGTLEDDQKRRDFTINAMAISLNKDNFGELIDPFGGMQDLSDKILRTPLEPHQTYSDDPVRMMRAIRFATTLDFDIEENSLKAIKEEAERMKIVSMERIMVEFNKIMLSERPSKGLKLLEETSLLQYILPELTALKGIEDIDGQTHKDNFYHTLAVVDNISENTDKLWLRWSALLHDIGKAPTKKFVNASDSALRRLLFDSGEDLEDLFTLCKSDITTKNYSKQTRFKKNFEYVAQKIKEVEEKDQVRNFQPPISGEEIMEMFNLKPGREIGILKEKVKEAILEGEIKNDKIEAKDFVIAEASKIGLDYIHKQ